NELIKSSGMYGESLSSRPEVPVVGSRFMSQSATPYEPNCLQKTKTHAFPANPIGAQTFAPNFVTPSFGIRAPLGS
ncbi:MAG TPA: hypothetical protein VNZ64_23900, partial [Candidatus Acidoferrum sp.]|nr:hypothetical protein [Candidatus Acidoferrum sp.]